MPDAALHAHLCWQCDEALSRQDREAGQGGFLEEPDEDEDYDLVDEDYDDDSMQTTDHGHGKASGHLGYERTAGDMLQSWWSKTNLEDMNDLPQDNDDLA